MRVKAAVQVADETIEITELDVAPPSEGALLRIEGCGTCGSDLESYRGAIVAAGMGAYPYVPGHEPVGFVEWIDEPTARASGVAIGDRVAVEPFASCGVCRRCTAGDYRLCRNRFIYSLSPTTIAPGIWGGFAERMAIRPGSILHKVPEHVSVQDGVLFNAIGAGFEWAYRAAGTEPGDTVLVLGPGQRGLASVIAAREAGAERIIVTGLARDVTKLDLALAMGATDVLRADEVDVPEAVADLTEGDGADRVVDVTAGAPAVVNDALAAVRPGGTVVLAGLKDRHPVPGFVSDTIVFKDLTVRGALGVSSWSFAQALRVIGSGRYDFGRWHTHTLPLERLVDGFRLLAGEVPGEDAIQVTITPEDT